MTHPNSKVPRTAQTARAGVLGAAGMDGIYLHSTVSKYRNPAQETAALESMRNKRGQIKQKGSSKQQSTAIMVDPGCHPLRRLPMDANELLKRSQRARVKSSLHRASKLAKSEETDRSIP